jgi:hypothetical protein
MLIVIMHASNILPFNVCDTLHLCYLYFPDKDQ